MAALSQLQRMLGGEDPGDVSTHVAKWSKEGKYAFDERAGILQFVDRLSRAEAEREAYNRLKGEFENS